MEEQYILDRTVYKVIAGSHSYGMNTPESDLDVRGIAIMNDPKYYYGYMDKFDQFEDKEKDVVIYNICKFFRLAADNNPNVLELLFVNEQFRQIVHPTFVKVLENRERFLSKNIRYRFCGYAYNQLNRIKTHRGWLLKPPKKKPERSDFGLPERKVLTKENMGAFEKVMASLLKNTAEYLHFSDETKDELEKANWIGLVQRCGVPEDCAKEVQEITNASDEWMDALQREQRYINAKRHYNSYLDWKKGRNPKRAEIENKIGYNAKHAVNLVRLVRCGKEALETGKLQVFRPDREELLAIRNGAWEYDRIEEYAKAMEQEMAELYESSTALPKNPDRKFLNDLCIEVIEDYLKFDK